MLLKVNIKGDIYTIVYVSPNEYDVSPDNMFLEDLIEEMVNDIGYFDKDYFVELYKDNMTFYVLS